MRYFQNFLEVNKICPEVKVFYLRNPVELYVRVPLMSFNGFFLSFKHHPFKKKKKNIFAVCK